MTTFLQGRKTGSWTTFATWENEQKGYQQLSVMMDKATGVGELAQGCVNLRCTLDLQKGKNGYLFPYSESQKDWILFCFFATPIKNP